MVKVAICNAAQEGDARMMTKEPKARTQKHIFLLFIFCFLLSTITFSQLTDAVYKENIKGVRFHTYGDQLALPVYKMNSGNL